MGLSIAARPSRTEPDARDLATAGLAIVLAMLVVYGVSNLERASPYDHFVRQADAFLHGKASITLPAPGSPDDPGNGYFQDAMPVLDAAGNPTNEALIPFPPLPAVVLMPFVAIFGLDTNAQWLATLLAAIAVGLALRMLDRLPVSRRAKLVTTIFFGLGTVFWYAAAIGTTWYLAHIVAITLVFLALELALDSDARPEPDPPLAVDADGPSRSALGDIVATALVPDRRGLAAGLFLGLAATARLPVLLGFPFLAFVGTGDDPSLAGRLRRLVWTGLGTAIPVAGLLAYNLVSTGHLFHPAYDYQYQREAWGYAWLGYRPDWAIEDIRYIPQNLALMLGLLPTVMPPCAPGYERAIFSAECPWILPDQKGMSLLLTSPGWLIAVAALGGGVRPTWVERVLAGGVAAVLAITILNLAHFSQGWVQFGYRFSNDAAPFALPLVALGIDRLGERGWWLASLLVAVSVVVNLWGVVLGVRLGW